MHIIVLMALLCCVVAFVVTVASAVPAPGTVRGFQKISSLGEGGFSGRVDANEYFGYSSTALGDLDGDGITDLAVGAYQDNDGLPDAGAVYILFMQRNNTVRAEQKISDSEGNFSGVLGTGSWFGISLANLGDFNGDNITDIAVGAYGDGASATGAVFVLFLNTNGTVKGYQKIAKNQGNFSGNLVASDGFGCSVSALGDLNGDRVQDLAVGAFGKDDSTEPDRGAVYILFLNIDGTVSFDQMIGHSQGKFSGNLLAGDRFGTSIATLGDLNRDGIQDIVVGAREDNDGGPLRGALWILFLNFDGTVQSEQKISSTEGNFSGNVNDGSKFGQAVAAIGDINSDGIEDIAVGAVFDCAENMGAVFILFLDANGTVQSEQEISVSQGNFNGALMPYDFFGGSISSLSNPDSGKIPSIAVGAYGDQDFHGTLWILQLNSDATTVTTPTTPTFATTATVTTATTAATASTLTTLTTATTATTTTTAKLVTTATTAINAASASTDTDQMTGATGSTKVFPSVGATLSEQTSTSSSVFLPGSTISTEQLSIPQASFLDSNATGVGAFAIIMAVLAVVCVIGSLLGLVLLRRRLREIYVASMDDLDVTESDNSINIGFDRREKLKSSGPSQTGSVLPTDSSNEDKYGTVVSLTNTAENVNDGLIVSMSRAPDDPNFESIVIMTSATDRAADGTGISIKASPSTRNLNSNSVTLTLSSQLKFMSAVTNTETGGHDSTRAQLEGVKFASGLSEKVLGQGKFGKVYLAKWEGQEIAVKRIGSGVAEDLEQEINVLTQLNHPCIVRYFGLVDLSIEFGDSTLGIALEFCAHGSLDLALRKTHFSTTQLLEMSCQIAYGLAYLAGRGILHRDLAARNVLLDRAFQCKLADFGLARIGFKDDAIYRTFSATPIRWSAPETLANQSYSLKSDVYCLAVTITELWSNGQVPFAHLESITLVIVAIVNGERPHRPAGMPPAVYSELQKCWAVEARDRPSARDFAATLERIAEKPIEEREAADPGMYLEVGKIRLTTWNRPYH